MNPVSSTHNDSVRASLRGSGLGDVTGIAKMGYALTVGCCLKSQYFLLHPF
jgi:hypothetical protein